jgi:hypothetical protein
MLAESRQVAPENVSGPKRAGQVIRSTAVGAAERLLNAPFKVAQAAQTAGSVLKNTESAIRQGAVKAASETVGAQRRFQQGVKDTAASVFLDSLRRQREFAEGLRGQ